jgi:hypothetical protein
MFMVSIESIDSFIHDFFTGHASQSDGTGVTAVATGATLFLFGIRENEKRI